MIGGKQVLVLTYQICVYDNSAAMPGVNPGFTGVPYSAAAPTSALSYTMLANLDPHLIAQTIFSAVSVVFVTVWRCFNIGIVLLCCVTERMGFIGLWCEVLIL